MAESLPTTDISLARAELSALYMASRDRYASLYREITLEQYLDQLFQSPSLLRSTARYVADAMEHFGSEVRDVHGRQVRCFKFTDLPWLDDKLGGPKRVIGQELALEELHRQLCHFGVQARANQLLVFHGIPGSGKSRLVNLLQDLVEEYSANVPEGARFRLVWVFETPWLGRTHKFEGFRLPDPEEHDRRFEEGVFRIPASLNTDPFFVLSNVVPPGESKSPRERVLDKIMEEHDGDPRIAGIKNYALSGRLDGTSQAILEALLRHYKGDLKEVFEKHIRVERWCVSAALGRGIASIDFVPNHIEGAVVRPYNEASPFHGRFVPDVLESEEFRVHVIEGPLADASRGITLFPDLLRVDPARLRGLMETIEHGKLSIRSDRGHSMSRSEQLEGVFVATANNRDVVQQQQQGEEWDALKQKSIFITVAAPISIVAEENILRAKLQEITPPGYGISRHALEVLALFAVGTRLIKPQADKYRSIDAELELALRNFGVVEKALLLETNAETGRDFVNDINLVREESARLTPQQLQKLVLRRDLVSAEFRHGVGDNRFIFYDGGHGMTREIIGILGRIVSLRPKGPLTLLEVLEVLDQCAKAGFKCDTDSARIKNEQRAQGKGRDKGDVDNLYPFPFARDIFKDIARFSFKKVVTDINHAIGVVSEREADELLSRYLFHVRAFLNPKDFSVPEEHRFPNQKNTPAANEKFLNEFENTHFGSVNTGDIIGRRRNIIDRLVRWAGQHPNENVLDHIGEIFKDLTDGIMRVQRKLGEKRVEEFKEDITKYGPNPDLLARDSTDPQLRDRAKRYGDASKALIKMGYPEADLIRIVSWALSPDPISSLGSQRWGQSELDFGTGI